MIARHTVEVRGGSSPGRAVFGWRRHERAVVYVVAAQMVVEGARTGAAQLGRFGGRSRIAPLVAYMRRHDRALYRELLSFYASSADRLENALYNRGHKAFYANTEPRGAGRFVRSGEHYKNDPKLAAHVAEAKRIVAAKLEVPRAKERRAGTRRTRTRAGRRGAP